jgi:hypothetical protein
MRRKDKGAKKSVDQAVVSGPATCVFKRKKQASGAQK